MKKCILASVNLAFAVVIFLALPAWAGQIHNVPKPHAFRYHAPTAIVVTSAVRTHPIHVAAKPHKVTKHRSVGGTVIRQGHSPVRNLTDIPVVAPISIGSIAHAPLLPVDAHLMTANRPHGGVTVSAESAILSGPSTVAEVEKRVPPGTKIRDILGEQNGFYEFVLYKTNRHAWVAVPDVQLK